jgi:geranylgeranyl pyrophosphate synthase
MQRASAHEAQVIVDYLHSDNATDGDLQQVITLLHKYDTLQSTMAQAHEHIAQAKQCLQDFAPSPALDSLHTLADYVVARDV